MKRVDNKLFLWIAMLSFLAGATNCYSIIKFSFTIGHITGTLSKISTGFNIYDYVYLKKLLILLFFFFLGAVVSGLITESGREFELRKRYGDTLFLIGFLIKVIDVYKQSELISASILTFLLGMQNGLFIRYKGMVMRTTHMSGIVTDLGVAIGYCMRGNFEIAWKIKYYIYIILSFTSGGLITALVLRNEIDILNLLFFAYIFSGFYYFWLRRCYYKMK